MTGRQREDNRISVLFCHYASDALYGSDRSLFDLVTSLSPNRFRVAVVLRTHDPMAARYRDKGIDVFEIPFTPPRRSRKAVDVWRFMIDFWPSVFRVIQCIQWVSVDVVHVNTSLNLQAALAAKLARRPLIWHVREIGEDGGIDRFIRWLVCLIATHPVAISEAVAESLNACKPRPQVVYNAIDVSDYDNLPTQEDARRVLNLRMDVPYICTIGRLEPWKGQHIVVEAIPLVLKRHPACRFLFVGGAALNKPEYLQSLVARCRELRVQGRVDFLGARSDVPWILTAADICLLPSVRPEPFGRTPVEAMLSGRPVIATAAGGPLETVRDGHTGYLIPPNDPQTLADRICDLVAAPDRANEMGARGRARALSRFSLDRLTQDMEAVFQNSVDRGA